MIPLDQSWEALAFPEEVKHVIMVQKNKKAPGPDKLPAVVLKNDFCASFLGTLFTICLKNCSIPSVWRKGSIVPIPMKTTDDARVPLNFRGIPLLSVPYKAFSTILNERISAWLEENDILVEEQNGFRPGRCTLEHILSLTSVAQCRAKLGKPTLIAFTDLKKAYNSIDHAFLWQKLQKGGIMGQLLKMLQCLYSGITSAVRVNSYTTEPFKVKMGLWQGCVLSPTLFNLFINDLHASLKIQEKGVKLGNLSLHSLMYADDVATLQEILRTYRKSLKST